VFAPTGIDANLSADLSRAGPPSFPAHCFPALQDASRVGTEHPKQTMKSQVPSRLLPAKPKCLVPLHEHSHPPPSSSWARRRKTSGLHPLCSERYWLEMLAVSSAGPLQASGNIFSLPGMLRGLQETSSATRCQLLVCHGGSVASPARRPPDARMPSG